MTDDRRHREPATFRFDPHPGDGGPLGIGLVRSAFVGGVLAATVLSLYDGRLIAAAALLVVGVPLVLASWQGLPLLLWMPLRVADRLGEPRRWEADPELVGMSEPVQLFRETPRC